MSDGAALRLDRVVRTFVQGPSRLEVLRGASLTLQPGEMAALVGPSGAGKSTLLHVAGLLERPDGGEVYILGRPCGRMSDSPKPTRLPSKSRSPEEAVTGVPLLASPAVLKRVPAARC